jgi:hypothetical protein
MGNRDEYIVNDDHEDAAMRRMLSRHAQPLYVAPPPDLVTRTARKLPRVAPAVAAHAAARRRTVRAAAAGIAVLLVLLLALIGLFDVMGAGPQLAFFFGDGSSGVSEALLMARLLVKPLVGTFFTMMPTLLVASSAVAVVGGWAWWALVRQPQLHDMAREVNR